MRPDLRRKGRYSGSLPARVPLARRSCYTAEDVPVSISLGQCLRSPRGVRGRLRALTSGLLLASALLSYVRAAHAAVPDSGDAPSSPNEPRPARAALATSAAPAPAPLPLPAAPLSPTAAAITVAPPLKTAVTPVPLVWHWSRFSGADYAIGLGAGAVALAAALVHPRPQHSLQGGLWFDEDVRGALRARPLSNRHIFRSASDVSVALVAGWPFLADALSTAYWYRGSRDVAQELVLIDLQTLAISSAMQGVTNVLVSRERPYGRNCGSAQLPSDSSDCTSAARYRSFYSSHSSFSFASAALVCTHHFRNQLLGPPWDALSCAGGYAVAATTATFRVVGDMHYASDVLTGALMGTIIGYGVPLLHYRNRALAQRAERSLQLELVPSPGGLGLLGIF